MYAIQILWDGRWTYVLDAMGESVQQYHFRENAEKTAARWRVEGKEENVRVVEYTTPPRK